MSSVAFLRRASSVPTAVAHHRAAIGCSLRLCSGGAPGAGVTDSSTLKPPVTMAARPAAYPPQRTVGGIFLVHCRDHPFKHSWEVTRMLRDLRLEFRGQFTIHPDIPEVRKKLWRARNAVAIERLDLDEAKELVGVPSHITFSDLAQQIPSTFGRGKAVPNPILRSKQNFMQYRRMRIRDVLHRDALEKRLLNEKIQLAAEVAAASK